ASVSGTDPIGWAVTNSGSIYHLNGLAGAAYVPAHTIIGGTAGDTAYSNVNNSIARNKPHNPFVQGTGTFFLTIAGLTAASQISDVTFSFGTIPGDDVPGNVVPEPGSLALLMLGSVVFGTAVLMRRKQEEM